MRYILLDRITQLSPPEVAHGIKCVSLSDDTFADHFPGFPILPGALILESLAQLAGVLLEATMRQRGRHDLHALLTMADRVKFRHAVRPGDRLGLEARVERVTEDGGQAQAWARDEGKVVAEAQLSFAFAQVTNPAVLAKRREYLNIWLTGSADSVGLPEDGSSDRVVPGSSYGGRRSAPPGDSVGLPEDGSSDRVVPGSSYGGGRSAPPGEEP